ncbi:MerR family transcriptional regulator [Ureibacillus aquaedulcis]|uniref:MerR family transcriptional regulator n=1 Tax=Ureibacillus aquaedulcis TaxID=3058421 RepID=A0ABT8GSU1_9BACL|nr:MerR family transcriptional regulator [Ureibacillus sp. BA0131]MDN4494467.1 MerR family transcriptional regulator [Ureibacillus sp. BA0131]
MKDYYKINEISKLYGIGVDSLRYYEKIGVLVPRRDTNGYRLYGLKDIYKLNIIRDLRQLDFSMQQIKDYLDHQCIENTLDLLHQEQELIQVKLNELQTIQKKIQERIQVLSSASRIKTDTFTIKTLPARPCLGLNTHITRDEEMDFAIKRLHRKHESKIKDFGNQLYGASVSVEDLDKGIKDVFNSNFFILEREYKEFDFALPAGDYLSLYYQGDYRQNSDQILAMMTYAKEKGYKIVGDPFEIYEIDNRDTVLSEEFLTEIQVKIEVE